MKIPITNICLMELKKMIKRKDFLTLLGILGIGLLFSVSIMTDGYTGAKQQSALYWITTQMLNSSILLIAPIILAYHGVQTMAQEIENGSLMLFDRQIRNRKRLYIAKSIALFIYCSLFFIVCLLIHFTIYFILVCKSDYYASNTILGNNSVLLLCVLFTLYLSTFLLIPQVVLFLGTFAKQGVCIGIIFLLILVAHNICKIPIIGLFSPWYYIIKLASDVLNTTETITIDPYFMVINVITELCLCVLVSFICIYVGMNILHKREL